jgi:hypothetical protein
MVIEAIVSRREACGSAASAPPQIREGVGKRRFGLLGWREKCVFRSAGARSNAPED